MNSFSLTEIFSHKYNREQVNFVSDFEKLEVSRLHYIKHCSTKLIRAWWVHLVENCRWMRMIWR